MAKEIPPAMPSDEPFASGDRLPTSRVAPSLFESFTDADIRDLITAYPLAWVSAVGGSRTEASLLPLLPELDADGRLVSLLGHMARNNALVHAFNRDPRALILVTGPHGYMSPELVTDRGWAPTWNYAQLRIQAEIRFDDHGADSALETLVATMEAGRDRPWNVGEMGVRYSGMARAVIAFHARIGKIEGRFKLGQDERPEVLIEILRNRPDDDLSHWMRRFNSDR